MFNSLIGISSIKCIHARFLELAAQHTAYHTKNYIRIRSTFLRSLINRHCTICENATFLAIILRWPALLSLSFSPSRSQSMCYICACAVAKRRQQWQKYSVLSGHAFKFLAYSNSFSTHFGVLSIRFFYCCLAYVCACVCV